MQCGFNKCGKPTKLAVVTYVVYRAYEIPRCWEHISRNDSFVVKDAARG
jgi:hypothetical protein